MTGKTYDTVVGVFRDRQHEQQAISALRQAGFTGDNVQVADHEKDPQADMSVCQALKDRGFDENEARFYQQEFSSGANLVIVRAGSRSAEARSILDRHQARFYTTGAHTGTLHAGPAVTTHAAINPEVPASPPRAETTVPVTATEGRTIRLHEEQLRPEVEKETVGEAVIRKEVKTEHRSIDVPVTREEIVIERGPASGNAPVGEPLRPGEEIRIPIREEHVHLEKTPVVTEEVHVGKRQVHDTERVEGNVRKEEIKVQRKGDVDINTTPGTPAVPPPPRRP